jgi:hypothetical protein
MINNLTEAAVVFLPFQNSSNILPFLLIDYEGTAFDFGKI